MRLRMWIVAGALMSASLMARADTTYVYTGNNFTNVYGAYTTSDFVSGSLTLASPLGDDLTDVAITPESFSFSDGLQTITNLDAISSDYFDVYTNASGEVTQWAIGIVAQGGLSGIYTSNIAANGDVADEAFSGSSIGYNSGMAGTFTEQTSVTPEPGSLMLLGTGLLGLAGLGWKRFAPEG